jgi:hypothetical protein
MRRSSRADELQQLHVRRDEHHSDAVSAFSSAHDRHVHPHGFAAAHDLRAAHQLADTSRLSTKSVAHLPCVL